jgi:thiamine biosynthesis lipoprotein
MITVGLDIWKTHLSLSLRCSASEQVQRQAHRLLESEAARLDRLASRFRSDSELSTVNARAGEWVDVSWAFVCVLTTSLDAARATGGLVDPTLGRALTAAGYDSWAGQRTRVPGRAHRGAWRAVGIRPGPREAQVYIPAGTALDLGAVAKGWLADRVATAAHRSGYDVCANMGGDIRVIATAPWTVWADPQTPDVATTPVDLRNAAVATSSTVRRSWSGGHHIIDPRTGHPCVTPWRNVSVVAATAAQGPAWMTRRGLDSRFVGTDHAVTTGRWPAEVAA